MTHGMSEPQDVGRVFQSLGSVVGLGHGFPQRQRAMALENQRVVAMKMLGDCQSQLFGDGPGVRHDGQSADAQDDFGEKPVQLEMSDQGERDAGWRVGVNDDVHVRSLAQRGQVHRQLAAGTTLPGNQVPALVDNHQLIGLEKSLVQAGRGDQDPAGRQSGRNISIVGGQIVPVVEHSAKPDDV